MSVSTTENRACLACGTTLRGRIDKRFCNDYCRNNYNNLQKSRGAQNELVRQINNVLQKNRRLLESILAKDEETAKTNRDKLLRLGFNFKYFTHLYTTKTGKTYWYCYEYGYLPLENDWILVVRTKKD
jgi:predicted nucleic acid-binding Zn ribbon protein